MKLRGCYVAIVTPFLGDGVDTSSLAAHASWLVDNGVSGVVVCGTTGETATMHEDEKILAMNTVVEAVGQRAVVVGGAGNNSTSESVDFVRRVCRDTRVDAIMSVVPYYVKPTQRGMVAHFGAIAATTTVPMIVYNVPGRTVVSMTAETILECLALPNVVAVKEASADLMVAADLHAAIGDSRSLMSGDDASALAFIACGGHGVISVVGNVAPRLVSDLCAAALSGDLDTARALNTRLVGLHRQMFCDASPGPAKLLTEYMGFGSSAVRLPLVSIEATRARAIIDACLSLGVAR
jgi:4-hydroxy-tetrahydrodipicolinate synthase